MHTTSINDRTLNLFTNLPNLAQRWKIFANIRQRIIIYTIRFVILTTVLNINGNILIIFSIEK